MKKRMIGVLAASAALALGLSACSGSSGGTSTTSAGGGKLSVALAVNGALGDQGFFDDAQRGMVQLKKEGHKTQTLQADVNNPAQWKSNLESVSTGSWSLAVAGTSQMTDIMTATAKKFPAQKFIIFDTVVNAPNVASITYKQNEGSFLAGVLAAYAATDKSSFPLSSGSKTVGVVGGMDIPVINDFVVGFKAGVKAVDSSIKVEVSYVGSFSDSAKGYDQAKAMYADGADVVFQAAGGSGIGVLQAAKDANKYAIGVDQNQNALQPGHVLASMLKHVGNSLVLAVDAAQAGKLKYGKTTSYGLANDGVGLDFDNNSGIVPDAIVKKIDALKQEVIDGKLTVPSASGAE
jgi:basic membrane protein A